MRLVILLTFFSLLMGCASHQYGVYAQIDSANSARLAIDASNVLPRVYAPSVTRLNINQNVSDEFGNTLILLLRQKGYAVAESSQYFRIFYSAPKEAGFTFNYVVDQLDADQCRLTLLVDVKSISRMYHSTNGIITPAGFWAKKE